jgi:hypothetical protein
MMFKNATFGPLNRVAVAAKLKPFGFIQLGPRILHHIH